MVQLSRFVQSGSTLAANNRTHTSRPLRRLKMTLTTRFGTRIRPSVQAELDAAAACEAHGRAGEAFGHLERAHVLGQADTLQHVRVHWAMLRWGLRNRSAH